MVCVSDANDSKNASGLALDRMGFTNSAEGFSSSGCAANGVSFFLNHKKETPTLLLLENDLIQNRRLLFSSQVITLGMRVTVEALVFELD